MLDLTQIFLAISLAALALAVFALWRVRLGRRAAPLPKEWAISPRPVFTVEERAAFRQLREALPHHVVLAKLPLTRFCQPLDATDSKRWYELLGSIHVSFAVCSPNGRVIAAIDLDSAHHNTSRRALAVKEGVCQACRVRYVRFGSERLPSVAELQTLVPQQGHSSRSHVPPMVGPLQAASATLAHTVRSRRAARPSLWQDSVLFHDSFFAPDSRMDGFGQTDPAALTSIPPPAADVAAEPAAAGGGAARAMRRR